LTKKYGLVFSTTNIIEAKKKAVEFLSNNGEKLDRSELFEQKMDMTAFLIWFIEKYPKSHEIVLKDPEYQNKFIKPMV
jgi:16S rRNA G966 N2-methylase RsmD